MNYYVIIRSWKLIIFLFLVSFTRQSTSKTKRSKKDGVLHVTRRQSDVSEENSELLDLADDVIVTSLKEVDPELDVGDWMCRPRCESCDPVNGCIRCRSRTFLYIERKHSNERGICLHQCPAGYYGARGSINTCKKCEEDNCLACFTQNYCTSCQSGFYLHNAKCTKKCPANYAPNKKTKKCEKKVDCIVSAWSSWSKCARRSPSRSCKYGKKKRSRDVVQEPTDNGKKCPKLKETRRCNTPENECPLINRWVLQQRRQLLKKNKRKNARKPKRKRRKRVKVSSNRSNVRRERSNNSGATKRREPKT